MLFTYKHLFYLYSSPSSTMEEALEAQLSDSGEFSCPRYMNAAFPSEQALCGLDAAAGRCAARAEVARGALRAAVRGAHEARRGGAAALRGASDAAASLALQVGLISSVLYFIQTEPCKHRRGPYNKIVMYHPSVISKCITELVGVRISEALLYI